MIGNCIKEKQCLWAIILCSFTIAAFFGCAPSFLHSGPHERKPALLLLSSLPIQQHNMLSNLMLLTFQMYIVLLSYSISHARESASLTRHIEANA